MEFDYNYDHECAPSIILLWFLLYIFECRISFLIGSSLFIDGCSAVSCDFGVLVRGDELKFLLLCHVISNPPCFGGKKKSFT